VILEGYLKNRWNQKIPLYWGDFFYIIFLIICLFFYIVRLYL
jgi:hypothetical protein